MKKPFLWIGLAAIALFLFSYNLHETTIFIADVARDTLRSLQLWKEKEITLIGPPASFGQYGTRTIFFGSMTLYAGMVGLVIGGLDPVAVNLVHIILFIAVLPFLYDFLKRAFSSDCFARAGTIFYVISPLTVTHARFFWNVHYLIPLSVIFWWSVIRKKPLLAGVIAGIMINVHYVAAYLVVGYVAWSLLRKHYRELLFFVIGTTLMSLPLILFELRNQFYLTHAIVFNLQNGSGGGLARIVLGSVKSIVAAPFVFSGFFSGEIDYPMLIPQATSFAGVTMRYLFPMYPIIIWIVLKLIHKEKRRIGSYALGIFMLGVSLHILFLTPDKTGAYIPLQTVEQAAAEIVKTHPKAPYNISENIIGDARGVSYRYFLLRDAAVQPENIETYIGLDTLYVVSPSLKRIQKEKRWEFTATKDLELDKTIPVDGVNVYVFKKASPETSASDPQ